MPPLHGVEVEGTGKMRADQERVKKLLVDTVTLLCKNGLFYQEELRVEGLLGVTLDGSDVFFVHISQKLMSGEEPHADVLLPSDLTLAPTNSHGDIRDDALDVTPNNKMPDCHDNRIVIRPAEERGQHSRSASPSRYQQSSRSSIHSEDSNSMVDGQDLRRGTKREQEENAMESVKYLRRPDPSSRVPMPQDDSELVHPQGPPGETLHPNFSQFDQLIAAANQASSGEAGGGKRRAYVGSGGEPSGHALPPSGAFVTGIARSLHGEAANTPGPAGAGGPGAGAQGGAGGGSNNEWPNTTSALEMAAHLAQSQTPGQLSVDTSALASTSSWPNTPISSAGQGPGVGQFGATDMYRIYRSRSASNKGYMCDYDGCNRTFYQRSTLYRHQRQKHGAKHRLHPRRQSVYSLSPPYSGALNLSTNHHSASSGIKRESDGDRPGASGILGALGTSGTITPAMLKERLVTQPVSSMESLIMNLKSMQSMLPTKPELRYEQIDNLRLPLPIRDMYLSKLPHIDTFSVSPRKDGANPRGEGAPPPGYGSNNSTPGGPGGGGAGAGGGPSSRLPPVASFSSASQSDPQAGGSSNRIGPSMHNDQLDRLERNAPHHHHHHLDDEEEDDELDERPMRRPPLLMPGAAADHHHHQPRSPTSSDSMGPDGPASLESSQYNQDARNLDSSQSDMGSPQ